MAPRTSKSGKDFRAELLRATTAAHRGVAIRSPAAFLVREYNLRLRLCKLGYTSRIEDENEFLLDAFYEIDLALDRLRKKDAERKPKG